MDIGSPRPTTMMPISPLTGTSDGVGLVRFVDVAHLIDGYRRRFGVDVASLFAGVDRLRLMRDAVSGLSFFDPPITGDAAFYAAIARRHGYHRPDKAEFGIAADHIPPGARVLEVGAGIGHFAAYLREADYLGLEFNADAVAAAAALGIHVVQRDVCAVMREQPERFDVTCAFQVLEHVADPRAMIEAMVALTRPGGRVILATPNADSYVSRSRDLLNVPPHHLTWWEDRTWHWVAARFGLVDLRLHHTPIGEMLGAWAQMVASEGIARQLGLALDPVVDESPLRQRIDSLAAPVACTILAGLIQPADSPAIGHTTVAVFTKPATAGNGPDHANP